MDLLQSDGLSDPKSGKHMGELAERTGKRFGITKRDADEAAIHSYERAQAAGRLRRFAREIVGVPLPGKTTIVGVDEQPGVREVMWKIRNKRPRFDKLQGIVSDENSLKLGDGAQGILLASDEYADENHITPLAVILAMEETTLPPEDFLLAGIEAAKKCAKKVGIGLKDIDYFELDEQFSIIPLLAQKLAGISLEKINVNGGSLALGNPLG